MGALRGSPGPAGRRAAALTRGLQEAAAASILPVLPLLLFDPPFRQSGLLCRASPRRLVAVLTQVMRKKGGPGSPVPAPTPVGGSGQHRRRAGLTGPRGLQWTSPCGWWVYLCHLAFPRSPPHTTLSPDTGVMGMNRGGFLLWVLHALSTEWAHWG